jgi:hypothetical protein
VTCIFSGRQSITRTHPEITTDSCQKEKANLISQTSLYLIPATTYSCTHFRVQPASPPGYTSAGEAAFLSLVRLERGQSTKMKRNIWPTRNLYFQHVAPEELKLHPPKPTRDEAAKRRRGKTKAAWDQLKMKTKELGAASGGRTTRPAMKQKEHPDVATGT